jgi:P4 family phage/plasmid primase-like protien
MGRFNVPIDAYPEFYDRYATHVAAGNHISMTERHLRTAPVLIDLDLKFDNDGDDDAGPPRRRYTPEHIDDLVALLVQSVFCVFDTQGHEFRVYVMEKPAPTRREDGTVKDGVHIVIPDIVSIPEAQIVLRKQLLENPDTAELFNGQMGATNDPGDIIDEAVIERNGWMMYGSAKPGSAAYVVTRVFSAHIDEDDNIDVGEDDLGDPDVRQLVETLSITNKFAETAIKDTAAAAVEDIVATRMDAERRRYERASTQATVNRSNGTYDDLDEVRALIALLSHDRAKEYRQWIMLGWCLRNLDHRLLDDWIAFSKNSVKYKEGECERLWNYMREHGLGIGTLHMWAREDDPAGYSAFRERDLRGIVERIVRVPPFTTYDMALVVKRMYDEQFVCSDIANNEWWHFRMHRWARCDKAYNLIMLMSQSNGVRGEFERVTAEYQRRIGEAEDEGQRKMWETYVASGRKLVALLKNIAPKKSVLEECKNLFFDPEFLSALNGSTHLLGFENGVYDLETHEFRVGRPDDRISYRTKLNYVEYDPSDPAIAAIADEIDAFLAQVLPKTDIREYVLNTLASFLCGRVKQERFHIWTGEGSNGKSKLIELFEACLNDYACKLPITLLTQKRAQSNAATSEVARTQGRRFAVLQEPSEDERLNVGLMKELTGGDVIQARSLFKEPIEFKPQFSMVLTCNHLPSVPSDDGGTWRRIRVVPFTSRFVATPDPARPNEFAMDLDLSLKFNSWKEVFMGMLIQRLRLIPAGGFTEPAAVDAFTAKYRNRNNLVAKWAAQCLEQREGSWVSYNELFTDFKAEMKEQGENPSMRRDDFVEALLRILRIEPETGNTGRRGAVDGLVNWTLQGPADGGRADDDDLQ